MKSRKCICSISSRRHFTSKPWQGCEECHEAARNATSLLLLSSSFATIAVLVLTGILLVRIGCLFLAAAASLLTWVLLGFLGVCIAEQPRDADQVISLMEQGRFPLKTPLRWHGHLRDEPTRLPWGYGYEIELSGVAFEDALQAARGGLRLGFTAHPEGAPPPDLHAGDEVAVLTEAKRPQFLGMKARSIDARTWRNKTSMWWPR